jgi:hypothetical protein
MMGYCFLKCVFYKVGMDSEVEDRINDRRSFRYFCDITI